MIKKIKILVLFLMIIFLGCAKKEYIFVPTNTKCIKKTSAYVGIEEIKLPFYMNDLEIMELKNSNLFPTHKYLSKEPSEIIMTKLSNILCDPNVFIYPWGNKADYKIKVLIDDFYFNKGKIHMYARIYINSKYKKVSVIKKCKNEYNCINEAFDILVNEISKEIK